LHFEPLPNQPFTLTAIPIVGYRGMTFRTFSHAPMMAEAAFNGLKILFENLTLPFDQECAIIARICL